MADRANAFLDLVRAGRIKTISGLKSAFRAAAKKAHPDSAGFRGSSVSERISETFIRLREDYEEALAALAARRRAASDSAGRPEAGGESIPKADPRAEFYSKLYRMERSSPPFWFMHDDPMKRYELSWEALGEALEAWKPEAGGLIPGAKREYDAFIAVRFKRTELFSLRNLFFNIVSYHLIGMEYYARRAEASLRSNLPLLEKSGSSDLEAFFRFLLGDLVNGPAILGEEPPSDYTISSSQ